MMYSSIHTWFFYQNLSPLLSANIITRRTFRPKLESPWYVEVPSRNRLIIFLMIYAFDAAFAHVMLGGWYIRALLWTRPIDEAHRFPFALGLVRCRSLSALIILEPINHCTSKPPLTPRKPRWSRRNQASTWRPSPSRTVAHCLIPSVFLYVFLSG